jgi:hypothetical protein
LLAVVCGNGVVPRFCYLIHGLTVASELECPELKESDGRPEIVFRLGDVPAELPNGVNESLAGEALPGLFLLKISGTGNYLIRDGKEVVIDPASGSSSDALRLFLLGPVIGILLHQRGLLPLHASAIQCNDSAVVFGGATGAGKSTLAAQFFQRGYRILADDICAVDTISEPVVLPSAPYLSLWADSLERLGVAESPLRQVRQDLRKFQLPLSEASGGPPVPLRVCYILERSNQPGEIRLERIEGLRKIEAIASQTYRRSLVDALQLTSTNFEQACRIAVVTRVVVVRRAFGSPGDSMEDRVADAIERDLSA